jgi:hypothetical protein
VSCTYHLQLVLPKLLLLGLVEEGEVAHMVDEYEAQQGELRVLWGDLAGVGAEGRTEALEGGGRREFSDFILCLARDELALEVCEGGQWWLGGAGCGRRLTMLLLARQDGALWGHRHHGHLGVGGVAAVCEGTVQGRALGVKGRGRGRRWIHCRGAVVAGVADVAGRVSRRGGRIGTEMIWIRCNDGDSSSSSETEGLLGNQRARAGKEPEGAEEAVQATGYISRLSTIDYRPWTIDAC